MSTQYRCKNQKRLASLIQSTLNGIDFLEVSDDQKTLKLFCVHTLPTDLTKLLTESNVVITGGVRVQAATIGVAGPSGQRVVIDGALKVMKVESAGNVLTVTVNQPGDFSTYTLRLISSQTELQPPQNFDLQLSEVDFSFKVDCPSDFDCAPANECPPETLAEPEINYLAKDYASFRRLMLDRMSVIMPDWQERNAADVQIALVELLAYVGDHLSYFQDAVATEAYLGTAHRRTSIRRHARLLDYAMHEGCNARTWVCFEYRPDTSKGEPATLALAEGTQLLTKGADEGVTVNATQKVKVLREEQPTVFETLAAITLEEVRNKIFFYTWGDSECCLPSGATRATLVKATGLKLAVGDCLLFEEQLSPTTGQPQDADPTHRHIVRLTAVDESGQDTLPNPAVDLIEITWDGEDALPFPLCLSAISDQGQAFSDVSVARGNVVLADHGLRIEPAEVLPPVPIEGDYRPTLQGRGLTQQGRVPALKRKELIPFDKTASATAALHWDVRNVRPWIQLQDQMGTIWQPQRDLLNSDRFDSEFVVESEQDGTAFLRFGDGVLAQRPTPTTQFNATYRVGNGSAGNIGAEALGRVVATPSSVITGIKRVWNPLPASGGLDPESAEGVRQFAPQAFRTQERAVTAADYVEIMQRRPDVQNAAATLRWTGSWYTAFVTVDRRGGLPIDARYQQTLRDYLNRYRLAGYDLELNAPIFVPLEVVLVVCVKASYFRSNVKQALLRAFSNRILPNGQPGFFHPDNFTFGQPLYISQLYATALKVEGVDTVNVQTCQRFGVVTQQALQDKLLPVGPLEVIRLDNDPNFPENGKIDFLMQGGR